MSYKTGDANNKALALQKKQEFTNIKKSRSFLERTGLYRVLEGGLSLCNICNYKQI